MSSQLQAELRRLPGAHKLLDYHDVLLRADDVALLTGPHWLNDQAGVGPWG